MRELARRPGFWLALIGLSQMVGDLAGLPALKGLGAATAMAPAPKVFSAVRGFETFSSRFRLRWTGPGGEPGGLDLTPERYALLRGPYNRRNVYGAVLAYGPVLAADPRTRRVWEPVARYALCGEAPLLRELGVPAGSARGVRIVYLPPEGKAPRDLPLELEAPCG